MSGTRAELITKIEAFLARSGMSARGFGLAVHGDDKLVKRLRNGAGVTLTVIEKAERLMRDWHPKPTRRAASRKAA